MGEYLCDRCGWVVAVDRRANHDEYWCTNGEPDAAGSEDEEEAAGVSMQELFSPTCHSTVSYSFVHHQSLHLKFEQQSVFGKLDTGGALCVHDLACML
jgi:hypothetical protein